MQAYWEYLPFAFFNIISPFMTMIYAFAKIKIRTLKEAEGEAVQGEDLDNP